MSRAVPSVVMLACLVWSVPVEAAQTAPARTASSEVADSWSREGPGGSREPLPWTHWGLVLFLEAVEEVGGKVRLGFVLELKPEIESAWTSVGYPRYRTRSGRWHEALVQGLPGSRVITASTQGTAQGGFWVEVSRDVQSLRLAIGEETLELDIPGLRDVAKRAPAQVVPDKIPPPSPGQPVRLELSLNDRRTKPFGDGALDAGESGHLSVEIVNHGLREASGITIELDPNEIAHLTYPAAVPVPPIPPGGRQTVELPIQADHELPDTALQLTLRAREPFGHDSPPLVVTLVARAGPAPRLILTEDFVVEGQGIPVPRDSIVSVRLRVRNEGQGTAENVVARVTPATDTFAAADSEHEFTLGSLAPGEVAELSYRCYANQRAEQLAIHVELKHARSQSVAAQSLLALPLQDGNSVGRLVHVRADPQAAPPALEPPPPPLTSDVDRVVPRTLSSRPEALAVVLGVERYGSAPPASFSAEDARTAARYFEHALGIPPQRIQLLLDQDVTLGQLYRVFGPGGWIARRITKETELFVFFAGHGVSAGSGFAPYLVPADGDLNYIKQTSFPLDQLIEWLLALDGESTTVFLDTCFSGLTREGDGLFEAARPLVVIPSRRQPSGLSLFSAAGGTQLASGYEEQGHGLFSYFLFKGLAGAADLDADGSILAGELKRYLEREVALAAMELDREQDPSVYLEDPLHVLVEAR